MSINSSEIAIIGSGPAGCYAAQALLKLLPDAQITVFDRLVTPYGLIRYGVAADHQHTKRITQQLDRVLQDPRVRFAGNISVPDDVTLEELQRCFNAVVIASGLEADRALFPDDVCSQALVIGANSLIRALNSHPLASSQVDPLGSHPVIVGGGNVALDLLRLCVKPSTAYSGSDINDDVYHDIHQVPVQRVTLLYRGTPETFKGDAQMIKELGAISEAHYSCDDITSGNLANEETAGNRTATALQQLFDPRRETTSNPVQVNFLFNAIPLGLAKSSEATDDITAEQISLQYSQRDETKTMTASSVISAIGFTAEGSAFESLITSPAESGRVTEQVFRTGWAKRGSSGGIPSNRACAIAVAKEVAEALSEQSTVPKPGFIGLNEQAQNKATSFAQWLQLNELELVNATAGRVRLKITDHSKQLSAVLNHEEEK
ncbi:FAD-dependent oxidoreductase [Leucobacter sp. OH1287]|uniref:FAD-dependent oxidoreductase n=1 Tax=Leucobacter sp. OH1287 TaxID=2491049 RepID=UPI000F5DD233|nr:FAD-dependent oxidoreductase [Leucobacter sp. OH1287]RRD61565.1 hypothetical protein EII30_01680 [Leucobacter sp. OH1287]